MSKRVFVSNSIRDIHPLSPLAGQVLEKVDKLPFRCVMDNLVCEQFFPNERKDHIPVKWGDRIWYVEPEYVIGEK